MSTYPPLYGSTYGASFPAGENLAAAVDLNLAGTWTDITQYVLQRDGASPPITIGRGRPDETTTASPSSCTMQFNNRGGGFTARNPLGTWYGKIGKNTPLRVSVPDNGTALRIEDDDKSGAATAATPAGMPVTSQDIRLDLAMTGWSSCTLAAWWGTGQRAWLLTLNNDGTITLSISPDGTKGSIQSAQSTLPLPLGPGCLRVTYTWSTGAVTFWTAAAGSIALGPWTQLGSVVTTITASTTLFASSAPLSAGNNAAAAADGFLNGITGKVLDFMVLGTSGHLVAQGGFSSLPAGTTSWNDSQGNTWGLNGTAEISGRSYRGHFEMFSLPAQSDPTGTDIWVPVTGGGILRRIQQGNTQVPSPLKRYAVNVITPVAYWPCEDGPLATQIASGLSGGFPMTVLRGSMNFAADTSFTCSGPLPQISNGFAYGIIADAADTGTLVFRFLVSVPSGFTGQATFLRISTTGTAGVIYFAYDSTGGGLGVFSVGAFNIFGTEIPYTPGTPVMVSFELTASGGTVTPVFRVMTTAGVITSQVFTGYAGITGRALDCTVNPAGDVPAWPSQPGNTVIGHIFVQNFLNPLSGTISSVIQAWNGEPAGQRFARLCGENGIQSRVYGYPAVTAAMGPQPAGTLAQLLQECETADMGIITEPRSCLGLGYRTLASMTCQAPAVTLDYSQAHLGQQGQAGELQPSDDDQQTRNDVLVSRSSASGKQGGSYSAVLEDGSAMSVSPPPAGVGDYSTQVSVNVEADIQLPDVAGWLLNVGTVSEQRYPVIPLNLARQALLPMMFTLLAADLGDYAVIINPGAQLPPGPVKQLIYGTTERLGGRWYLMDWQCVPESPYETGLLDDLILGRADTDGSQLTAGAGATATLIGVTVTGPSGVMWTTGTGAQAGDFPFDVVIGGERVTVTNIDGPPGNFLGGQTATFDGGLGTWVPSTNCSIASAASPVHSGTGAMSVTSLAAGDMGPSSCAAASITTQGVACSPGDQIVTAAWWLAGTVPRQVQMGAQFFTAAGAGISLLSDSARALNDSAAAWTKVTGQVTAPATAAFCKLFPLVKATGAAGEVHYCDDAYLGNATTGSAVNQAFTVTRSVNGVVKTHPAGEDVRLYQSPVLAVM